jgi:hypothetical protein
MMHPVNGSSTNRCAETERVFSSDVIDIIETATVGPCPYPGSGGHSFPH